MTYYCEKLAPGFLKMAKEFEDSRGMTFPEDPNELNLCVRNLVDDLKDSEEVSDVLDSLNDHFSEIIRSDSENLTDALELYYTKAKDYYEHWEYYSSSFHSSYFYFSIFNQFLLYLCGKNYDSMEDPKNSEVAYFFSLLPLSYYYDYDYDIPEQFENKFKLLLKYGSADWLCVIPSLSHFIGEYYLSKEKYGNAYEYFKFGAELDYDGRQTDYPFHCVGKNQYKLGEMYYKGLGRNKNTKKALDWFSTAADNFAREALPVMGDIYYEGDGVEKNHEMALFCYGQHNEYYRYYEECFYLNDEQKARCRSLLNDYYDSSLPFEDKTYVFHIYRDVLKDQIKAEDIHSQIIKDIEGIPMNERTSEMDEMYVEQKLEDIKKKLTAPLEPTGSVPDNLKENDTFTFGQFLGEPIEWKVLNIDESNNTAYVITTKILAKMKYNRVAEWLNEDFLNSAFTEEQKKKIVFYSGYEFRRNKEFGIYLADKSQLEEYEGTYPVGTVKETEFAKSLCKTKEVWELNNCVMNEDGSDSRIRSYSGIYGIRPAMDVHLC